MRRGLAIVVAAAAVALVIPSFDAADAHDPQTYFGATWDTEECTFLGLSCDYHDITIYRIGSFNTSQRNRISDAVDNVSALHEQLTLDHAGTTSEINQCASGYEYNHNTIRWEDMGEGVLGRIWNCGVQEDDGHYRIVFFNVSVSAYHRDNDEWDYGGTGINPPDGKFHFVGTVIHEFIHGTGFGAWRPDDDSHFFDDDTEGACPDNFERNIMCAPALDGINRGWAREHDAHTTTDAYNHFRGD